MHALGSLLSNLTDYSASGDLNTAITGLSQHHAAVENGHLYIAIKGYRFDGDDYVQEAWSRGASAVISTVAHEPPRGACAVQVKEVRCALAQLAAGFYNYPSRQLRVIAVTGTNGKTTTTFYLDNILRAAGYQTGLLGTVGYRTGRRTLPASHTTPGPIELQHYLRQMVDEGAEYCIMEVSAHALTTERVAECEFDVAVFTNLSPEHLNFYPDLASYQQAKSMLFSGLGQSRFSSPHCYAVVNGDDAAYHQLVANCSQPVLVYGSGTNADLRMTNPHPSSTGFSCHSAHKGGSLTFTTQLPGLFNLYNALSAASVALEEGVPPQLIRQGIEETRQVPGRYRTLHSQQGFCVWVDFAHNPQALQAILQAARQHHKNRRVILVTGCEGGTDIHKRHQTGRIAASWADHTIITCDNIYHDDPAVILADIEDGITQAGGVIGRDYRVEGNRYAAIKSALELARPSDLVK